MPVLPVVHSWTLESRGSAFPCARGAWSLTPALVESAWNRGDANRRSPDPLHYEPVEVNEDLGVAWQVLHSRHICYLHVRVCGLCFAKPLTAIGRRQLTCLHPRCGWSPELKEMSVNSIVFTDATGLESNSEYIS